MIARLNSKHQDADGFAYDKYFVDDGSEIFTVFVFATGRITILSSGGLDEETQQAITCAVLEQEQKRGF